MSDWKGFFERHKNYNVTMTFYGCERAFSLEELYQAFKARAEEERTAEQQGVVRLEVPVTCEKHYWHSIVGAPCPSCSAVNQGLTQNGQLVCPKCRYFFFPNESMS